MPMKHPDYLSSVIGRSVENEMGLKALNSPEAKPRKSGVLRFPESTGFGSLSEKCKR